MYSYSFASLVSTHSDSHNSLFTFLWQRALAHLLLVQNTAGHILTKTMHSERTSLPSFSGCEWIFGCIRNCLCSHTRYYLETLLNTSLNCYLFVHCLPTLRCSNKRVLAIPRTKLKWKWELFICCLCLCALKQPSLHDVGFSDSESIKNTLENLYLFIF